MQTTSNSSWKPGIQISKSTTLFDLDNNPSAYLFELKDSQGDENGYIVVSASKNEYPIIEYSYQGSSFFNVAKAITGEDIEKKYPGKKVKPNDTKLYYLGDTIYLEEVLLDDNTKHAYNISTSAYNSVNIDDLKKNKPQKSADTQYFQLWDSLSKIHIKQQSTGGSNPPDNNVDFITNPDLYESGYYSSSSRNVTGYNITYNEMSDFHYGGVCAPTAATNLCAILFQRGYTNLKIAGN
jgi:hypothetical protein